MQQAFLSKRKHEVIEMQMTSKPREVTINFSRERLHSVIVGALRRKRIPNCLRGYDLVRGTVFGLIDHPEYSLEKAIEKAVEVCSVPGAPSDVEAAYIDMFDCIEPALRECDFYEDFDPLNQRLSEREVLKRTINGLVYDVKKDFCYSSTIAFMREKNFKDYFAYDILKNMIFKKLVAEDSTKECMYKYAYRKTFVTPGNLSYADIVETVDKEVAGILPYGESNIYDYVLKCVDEIYASQE